MLIKVTDESNDLELCNYHAKHISNEILEKFYTKVMWSTV